MGKAKNKKKSHFTVTLLTNQFLRITSSHYFTEDKLLELVKKVFQQKNVKWIKINFITKSFLIHYSDSFSIGILEKEDNISFTNQVSVSRILFTVPDEKQCFPVKITFYRIGNTITNWEVVHQLPDRIRLKHFLLVRRKQCCQKIERALLSLSQVVKYKVNHLTGSVLVYFGQTRLAVEEIVNLLENSLTDLTSDEKKRDEKNISNFEFSTYTMGFTLLFPEMVIVSVPLVLGIGYHIYKGAFQALRKKKIKVDILDAVVITGCLAAQRIPAAAFMVWAVDLADKILNASSNSTKKLLTQLFGDQPRFAWVKKGEAEVQVPIVDLKKGDIVIVHAGDSLPVDGQVVDGEGLADESSLTGESQPVEKRKRDKVFTCTTLVSGMLLVSVEKTGQETMAGKIQNILEESVNYKTKIQSTGEKIADRMVIPTLALGGLGLVSAGPSAALAVVNADFGTGIRVAAPTLLLSHLVILARQGILVKNGSILEILSSVDVFIFDKTGTLTYEIPEVDKIVSLGQNYSKDDILKYAATAEQRVSHPIARAILAKAKKRKIKLPSREETGKCYVGLGIEITTNGHNIKVGSIKYLDRERVKISKKDRKIVEKAKINGNGVVAVSINNILSGYLELKTSARPDAHKMIKFLKENGIKETVLISGDHEIATKNIARELGIDDYQAEVLPQDKAEFVKAYKKEGKTVAMVGDGINDAPALALADVSISIKGGSDVAIDKSDIIFLEGHFDKAPLLFEAAKKFRRGVWENFYLIAIPNSVCIVGALTGVWGLGTSLILNNGFNCLATINSLRPFFKLEAEKAERKELELKTNGKPKLIGAGKNNKIKRRKIIDIPQLDAA